ncbi:MAG: phytanoyl-CoA dioxygenase [Sphingomonas bacterium]|uniref:phytanoyl-CoA dioxygenase family protein n=1 Tax=Sphingomonas bacterium TaxID=1895847 RepID=UPI00260523F8|nr:phytanoyl-CoA dioxygenase family protein [Sphingomonas bacterium]MDB5710675.1 phytanoyl-CoA dioxygenase [Sphingomonas bacterium]
MASLAPQPPSPTLAHVRGVEDYWQRHTGRAPPRCGNEMADRLLLDALGLGIEQTMTYVMHQRPDYASFEAWVFETVGVLDADLIERYNAWVDGSPAPIATLHRLAAIDAMPAVLDADDLAHWDEHGYVVLRAAISRSAAADLEALLWQVVDARPDDPDSWYGARTNGIMIQHFQHPAQDVVRRSARVHKAFAQLWGTSDLWSSTDRMSFNPPERLGRKFPGPHLHWDVSIAQPIALGTQGILYMTDTAADQGALQLVPGFQHRIAAWLDQLGGADPRQVDLSDQTITVPANAGDLVIWRYDLPHGASPNRSDRPRMAQYANMYAPHWVDNPVWL